MLISTVKRVYWLFLISTVSFVDPLTVLAQSGTVFRDYNANGVRDAGEPGVGGILVRSFANSTGAADSQVSSTTTSTSGTYSLTGGMGIVRVEFTLPTATIRPTGPVAGIDYPGFKGPQSGTNVQFVESRATDVNFAINNPSDYCGAANTEVVTTCFVAVDATRTVSSANRPALVGVAYDAKDDSKTLLDRAEIKDIGSAWGLAYKRQTKEIFSAAFTKRHVGFGRGGPGAIYVTNVSSGTGVTTEFFNFGPVAGTNMHTDLPADLTPNGRLDSYDIPAYDAVGKTSLGDLDISDDEQTLYVVNLQNRKLYSLSIASKDTVGYAIPNPGCRNGEYRPFALKYYRGRLYVGVTCTNESATSPTDTVGLKATVYAFAGGAFSPVLSFPLTYPKAPTNADKTGVARAEVWRPWTATFRADRDEPTLVSYPQPWLTGIEFDVDGAMLLGIRDRYGDQMGFQNRKPIAGDQALVSAISPGEILRAGLCGPNATTWQLETNGSVCGNPPSAEQTAERGPGNGKYYWGDRVRNGANHGTSSMGALALLPGSGKVAMTAVDPTDVFNTGGIKRLLNATGAKDGNPTGTTVNPAAGVILYTESLYTYGKANGLGDLELVCGSSPIEIGNRFWRDTDRDGIQDPGEDGIEGVTLQLYEGPTATGTPVSTTITGNDGHYYFNATNVPGGLKPNTVYTIRVATALQTGPLGAYNAFAQANANGTGTPGIANSKVDASGVVSLTTGSYGQNNFNYDVAVVNQPCSVSLTATAGTCQTATNQYTVTGTVTLSGVGGESLTLTDGTVSTIVSATGTSPQSYTLTGLVSDGAIHTITATLSNPVCGPFSVTYTAPTSCSVTPVLTLTKFVDRARAGVGDVLTYAVVLTNSGSASATATTVRDSLGIGSTYVAGSVIVPASTSFVPGNPVSLWQVPTLAAGQSLTLTFQARADSVGILYNTATIPGDTATACTSIPVRVCVGESYTFRLSAPAGRSSYRWSKDGVELTGQTGNFLDITAPGAYNLTVDDGAGQCPDFSCCPYIVIEDSLPSFRATAVAATCVGNVAQANGRIVLSGYNPTHTYQYSVGTRFNPAASLSGAPKPLTMVSNGLIVGDLAGVTTATAYTVRVYNGAGCFTDVTVSLPPTVCICPAEVCTPFVVSRVRSSPFR